MAKKSTRNADFTVPGLTTAQGHAVAEILQQRLHALNDLQLTLKHAHWNVVCLLYTSDAADDTR